VTSENSGDERDAAATESLRLAAELKARDAELAEALEQQAATAEILKVISSSPTDTQPVFDAIVKSGVKLFGGLNMTLRLVKGDFNETVATSLSGWDEKDAHSTPLNDDRFVSPRAMMRRGIVHVPDIREETWLHEKMRERFEKQGCGAVLCAPMLRENRAIGTITVIRAAPGAFNDKQIALLKTFAAQAVIAIENVRLFNETKDALDQQRASGEVLRVISSSVEDTKPVFEAILQGCGRLFEGRHVGINLVEDGQIHLKAYQGPARGNFEEIFPLPLSPESGAGMAILERRVAHYPDVEAGNDVPHYVRRGCEIIGIKSVIFAPMLQDGGGIGAIFVGRDFPGAFSEKEISLLQTFADQAVIAIQNVRLFNETREALEQQTATADILRVISSSPTDTQPVFEAVAENSARLCEASDAVIHLREGDELRYVAHHGRISTMPIGAKRPIRADWVAGRAALVARQIHVFDAQAEHDEYPDGVMLARLNNYRTILVTPMLHEGAVVGTIAIRRTDARSFTEKQMALVRTFANQGAIAIENVRLFKELQGRNAAITEALEQQTATAEILKVISSSPTDIQPVLDAVAGSAARLCGTDDVYIRRIDGETTRRVAHVGTTPMEAEGEVRPLRLRTIAGAVARECKTIHIPDVTEPHVGERYPESLNLAGRSGFRTFLYVPLVREGTAIGMIVMRRRKVRPFTDKQIELLETFAAQAVIAIENVRLFNETKEALEQQTVTAEILKVISSSPTDVQPVFDAIVRSGRQLFRGLNVSLRVVKGDHAVRVASTSLIDDPSRDANPIKDEGLPGVRAMSCREAVQIPDILAEQWVSVRVKQTAELRGWRAILSAPMLRENDAIGLISVTRVAPGPFSEKEVALLKTFAAQAVIAIENVRLFKELEARNAEVSEALKRQTATAEILEVISSSPTNVEPVFQAVAERAARICDATNARVFLVEGGNLRCAAEIGGMPGLAIGDLVPLDRGWPTGRAVIDRRIMHIEDVTALPVDEYPIARRLQSQFGHRTILVVPLMRENVALGAILLRRMEVRPFDDKQVALLQTFAAQAVIAIENARLFNEIRQKSRELESANKHKSEFLANMSHELRTPLNAIIGFSEALVEKMFGELNPKQEDYLRDIHSSGRHLLSLINDILDLSKIEAGRMELDLSEFSVPMALKNAMSLVRGRAQTHGIALKLRLDPKLSEIRADERKFKQIVVNLLSNAVKFTPDGGSVQLNARLNRELLKISVKDDGIGIAQADQAALFEAFRQVGKSSSGQREGTGLGLALSRRFVELHGGKIELDSKPGKGSTFTFTLPVQPGARRATRGKGLS
jgi:signal transduction histidine kinase/putative methionine-R-sulfoxide reductase with GAF domain